MAARVRLFSIASVQLAILESQPPKLAVTVHGYAVSSGWTDPALVPLEKKLSADGILDLDFVGTPPDSINMPVLSPQTAELVWADDVDRLVGVRIVSRTGDVVRLIARDSAQAGETTQIVGEDQHPHFAAAAMAGPATTMATGEEGPPPISTMATGEETMMTTLMLGEEGGGLPPTTHLLGEEHHGYPPTTLMLGEEGGGLPPTTHMLGEEGGGLPPTTLMLGEEGGGVPPTTQMVGEFHPHTTAPRLEEVHTDIASESTVDPGTTTQPRLEEVADVGGLQEAEASRTAGAGGITTLIQGEEQGGGGTVFTTLVVGEEGGTTAPWFEEMMPGPVIPPGGTSPTTDDPKAPAGEGWFDPQNFNPLGRR